MAVATRARPGAAAPAAAPVIQDTVEPQGERVLGMTLAMVANAMVLVGLLAAYFALRAQAFVWPPRGTAPSTYLPSVVTITAIMAMATMQWAVQAGRRNDVRNCLIALAMTMVLALAILNAEWYSLTRLGFPVSRHAYGTFRYVLVGYHMANVLAALVMVGTVFARAMSGEYRASNHDGLRAVARFWHFASVAWFAIFVVLAMVR